MAVGDTDFSPPATAVMFLLAIHPTALEAGDSLSISVKFLISFSESPEMEIISSIVYLPERSIRFAVSIIPRSIPSSLPARSRRSDSSSNTRPPMLSPIPSRILHTPNCIFKSLTSFSESPEIEIISSIVYFLERSIRSAVSIAL